MCLNLFNYLINKSKFNVHFKLFNISTVQLIFKLFIHKIINIIIYYSTFFSTSYKFSS